MKSQTKKMNGMWRYILFVALMIAPLSLANAQVAAKRFDLTIGKITSGNQDDLSNRTNNGSRLSSELEQTVNAAATDDNSYVDVIIQFKQRPGTKEDGDVNDQGGENRGRLSVINGNVYHVPVKSLPELAKNPDILYITPDRQTTQFSDYAARSIGADLAQNSGYDGTGVGVAIIDSGIYAGLPDLNAKTGTKSRVVYSESFTGAVDFSDNYGHGTHVAGIVGNNGASSNGNIKGIAPGANLINLKVLDANGAGTDSAVINAIQRAIQLKSTYNIRVINLSLGRKVFEAYTLDPLCQAVEQAWKAGIVVVVAAGNSGRDNTMGTNGYATIASPGIDPYVITVGATNTNGTPNRGDDIMASFSSKGPSLLDHVVKPDLVAPGNLIASLMAPGSTLPRNYPESIVNPATYGGRATDAPAFMSLSGTSMAAPMVSGAAAVLFQKSPNMTPDQIKARLMKTAGKLGRQNIRAFDKQSRAYNIQYDVFAAGSGYLDLGAALNSNEMSSGTALSPTASRANNGNVTITPASGSVWAPGVTNTCVLGICVSKLLPASVVWGTSVIWGAESFLDSAASVIWGNSVIWGIDDGSNGLSVIWGNSVIWGSDMGALSAGDADASLDDPGTPQQ